MSVTNDQSFIGYSLNLVQALFKKLWSNHEFCANWLRKQSNFTYARKQTSSTLSTFTDQSGRNSVYKNQFWFLGNLDFPSPI